MKTLIIDAQIWQTNAWYRGMGGYTRSLFSAYVKRGEDARMVLLLNKNMTIKGRIDAIHTEYPDAEIVQLDLPVDPSPKDEPAAKATIQAYVDSVRTADDDVFYLIPSLFLFSYAAVFPDNVKKILIFYDLTPLIYREHFAKYFPAYLYFARFKALLEADVIFTISETTGKDLVKYLGLPEEKLVNLDGSINEVKGDESTDEASDILKRLGLTGRKFFLLPTGGLPHKNNVRAAKAFRILQQELHDISVRLVATSFFEEIEKQELRIIVGDDIIFTGNITDQEIEILFMSCDVVLFPTLYEGLGMPVLEGVRNERPVACSDIAVFREFPHFREALYVFDPHDEVSIAEAMMAALVRKDFNKKKRRYPAIADKYNWDRSARLLAETLANEQLFTPQSTERIRIAVTCPDPRKNQDVAVFAQRMYGYGLTAGIEFVYFLDPGDPDEAGQQYSPDYVRYTALCYDISDFYREQTAQQFTQVVHFASGDPQFHKQLRAALAVPGALYVGNDSFLDSFRAAASNGLISGSQLRAEEQAATCARSDGMFENLTLLASQQAVIIEGQIEAMVIKALRWLESSARTLTVQPCTTINDVTDDAGLGAQAAAYAKVLDFLREKQDD